LDCGGAIIGLGFGGSCSSSTSGNLNFSAQKNKKN